MTRTHTFKGSHSDHSQCKRSVATKFTALNSWTISCMGHGPSSSKAEDNRRPLYPNRTPRRYTNVLLLLLQLQVIWDSLPQGMIDKAIKKILTELKT